jgi:Rab GDP dissociation inhibitor
LIDKFNLSDNTVDFVGHAVALYSNESFRNRPAKEVYDKIILYMNSMGAYGDSPFIYPIYGLAGIPEGFSRKCALFGGTFMLNKSVNKFEFEDGKVCGVTSGAETAKTKMVICSPTYCIKAGLKDKVKKVGNVIRCICILNGPIPNTKEAPAC